MGKRVEQEAVLIVKLGCSCQTSLEKMTGEREGEREEREREREREER